ncbi:protein FAR1-RELATED SEQUENCE 5-like [Silene latifolia]|uniref:protein FAR1-RELATED SEQUENCE 5-like n=1 Tax=Silene latifolia TaxID=37657 RepID=UPI003D76ECE2
MSRLSNVGASLEDFKNFSRDIKKFLSEGDAQMLIEHFMKIKRMCPSFYFDFEVDEKDLGIEGGLKKVFKDKVQHRYCMWHILKKLPEKVGLVICRESEFLKEINSCVWGEDVEPAEFEERWTAIVEAHGLSDNEWLQEKRVDENHLEVRVRKSFFSNFTNPNLTLVEFWMRFESAMDTQRWAQSKLIAQSKYSFPDLATPLDTEKHAETYTPRIFEEFKVEIKAKMLYMCHWGQTKR